MDSKTTERLTQHFQSLLKWMQKVHFVRYLGYTLSVIALGLGILTYLALTRDAALGVKSEDVVLLLNLDLGVLLLLAVLVAKRLVELWVKRKQGLAGSRLHVRLVVLLSVLTVTPTIVMAVLSGFFLNTGVQIWFSKRVQTALEQSSAVAEAYLEEHKEVIRANVEALKRDISENLRPLLNNKKLFDKFINRQADLRNLSEAIVFDSTPEVLARSRLTFALEFEFVTSQDLQRSAREVVVLTSDQRDRVRALVKIDPEIDIYLLVGRIVDAQVLGRIDDTENALSEYRLLQSNLEDIKLKFLLIFSVIALLLLIIAIWFGLSYATHLALPISRLLDATEKVRRGDLSTRVVIDEEISDLGMLSAGFNRMTKWIQKQQKDLVQANEDIDQRRRFIEAVLSGVSAGVVGLDKKRRINLANRSASELLNIDLSQSGKSFLTKVFPEVKPVFDQLENNSFAQREIEFTRKGHNRTFLVRIVKEKGETEIEGYIVTFDDITGLIQAQRTAAWADVARRIAHEIKNPLTPIQLSAERLKRKYLKQIIDDPDTFKKCIETISRQVEHIGKMVKEFSEFARMPNPVFVKTDFVSLCQNVLTLEEQAHPELHFKFTTSKEKILGLCDPNQLEQVLINLFQNAIDSIEARLEEKKTPKGMIELEIMSNTHKVCIELLDNGLGLPSGGRERLTDPYVTNKEKGTGLGLAIVKRIIEDHKGSLKLDDRPEGEGARVCLEIPLESDNITDVKSKKRKNSKKI